MNTIRRQASFHRCLFLLTGLAIMAWLPQQVSSQPVVQQTRQIVEVSIDRDKDKGVAVVDLRPNAPRELGFELKNNADEPLADVVLKIVQVVDGKPDRVLSETKIEEIDKAKSHLVQKFEKIKGVDSLDLEGLPPFKVQMRVQAKNFPPLNRELKLVIREPRDYIDSTVEFTPGADPADSVLTVVVESKDGKPIIGPHLLPAQLVLGPDIVPTKKGVFKQTLTGPNQKPALVAEGIAFERMLSEGHVYLNVDGYDRAFTYLLKDNTPKGKIESLPPGEIRVRIGAPRYSKPDGKFEVKLEVDGPLEGNYKVHVGVNRMGGDDEIPPFDTKVLKGLRQQKVALSISPTGQMTCKAEVQDWRVLYDLSDVFGRNIKFRVHVLKDGKKETLTAVPESRPLLAKTDPDDRTKVIVGVFAVVTLDDSAPEKIRLDLPKDKEWVVGAPLEVRASVQERNPTQAPIARAILIRGKAPKDDNEKIKDADILAEGELDPKQKDWKFILPPHAAPEALTLSVQFTTLTGVKAASKHDTILFKPAGPGEKKLYTIKGQVVIGALAQQGLEVTLKDIKGNVKNKTKTNDKGEFVFEKVEAGTYSVFSKEEFQNRSGETKAFEVPSKDKKELSVSVSLFKGK